LWFLSAVMGLEIREIMKDWRIDYALENRLTPLESIVTPLFKPDDQAVLQVFNHLVCSVLSSSAINSGFL